MEEACGKTRNQSLPPPPPSMVWQGHREVGISLPFITYTAPIVEVHSQISIYNQPPPRLSWCSRVSTEPILLSPLFIGHSYILPTRSHSHLHRSCTRTTQTPRSFFWSFTSNFSGSHSAPPPYPPSPPSCSRCNHREGVHLLDVSSFSRKELHSFSIFHSVAGAFQHPGIRP